MDNDVNITEEMVNEANKLENNPRMILALIDLLFMDMDEEKGLPS